MKILYIHRFSKLFIFVLIIAALFSSGCQPPPPLEPPPPPPNKAPVINYITAQHQVTPSSSSEIRCVASDLDNDTLTYSWSTSSGTITGQGKNIIWNAPQGTGSYTISVTVGDANGGEATNSVTISVTPKPNNVPVIAMIVTLKDKPPYTPEEGELIRVKRWSTVEIECVAEDPDDDEISYIWSATDGLVQGEGAKVEYIAKATGDQAVVVTATDSRGGQAKGPVYFHIPCCGAQ